MSLSVNVDVKKAKYNSVKNAFKPVFVKKGDVRA